MNNTTEFDSDAEETIHNPISWRQAIDLLVARGWRRNEVDSCLDILNGYFNPDPWIGHPELAPWRGIGHEMLDAEELEQTATDKWGIDAAVWRARIIEVNGEERMQQALSAIAREFWDEILAASRPCLATLDVVMPRTAAAQLDTGGAA